MRILKHGNETYTIEHHGLIVKEFVPLKEVFKYTRAMSMDDTELEEGLLELVRKDHNVAHYGDMYMTFMFTEREVKVA